jgi:hypothetical protein
LLGGRTRARTWDPLIKSPRNQRLEKYPMTVKERNDFTERMLFVLTSAVALKNSEQVRAATLALAEAHGMADYGKRVLVRSAS